MRILVSEKLSAHKMKTPEGYLVCIDAVLSRTGKQEYRRSEVWGDSCSDPDKMVQVDRVADEVFSDKALASFENKAICLEHPDEDVTSANHNQLSVGFVRDIKRGKIDGQDVMLGTLVITDEDAIKAVESGEYTELSCGYNCDIIDENNPQQRNIRGNHVALCKQGRAGIARIVDSVDDAEEDDIKYGYKDRMAGVYDKWYRYNRKDNGRLYDLGQRLASKEKNAPEHVQFIEVMHDAKVADNIAIKGVIFKSDKLTAPHFSKFELNGDGVYSLGDDTFVEYALATENKSAFHTSLKHYREGELFTAEKINGRIDIPADIDSVVKQAANKFLNAQGDSMKDADFSKETKQGYKVVELYRDGGRLHAIVKRSSDYVVALGYNTATGEWEQGRYDNSTLEHARETLMEEKPYARRVRDAITDSSSQYDKLNWLIDQNKNDKQKLKMLISDVEHAEFLLGTEKSYLIDKAKSYMQTARDSAEKLFTVSYVKDAITVVNKVRAKSLQDAIKKVKDLQPGVMTIDEAKHAVSILREHYQQVANNTWSDELAIITQWRDGWTVETKFDATKFQRWLGAEGFKAFGKGVVKL